jgi:hypothetical protein
MTRYSMNLRGRGWSMAILLPGMIINVDVPWARSLPFSSVTLASAYPSVLFQIDCGGARFLVFNLVKYCPESGSIDNRCKHTSMNETKWLQVFFGQVDFNQAKAETYIQNLHRQQFEIGTSVNQLIQNTNIFGIQFLH